MTRMKPLPKFLLIAFTVGGALYGGHYAIEHGLAPKAGPHAASIPRTADYTGNLAAPAESLAETSAVSLPSTTAAHMTSSAIRMEVMAWNAQMGLMFANG